MHLGILRKISIDVFNTNISGLVVLDRKLHLQWLPSHTSSASSVFTVGNEVRHGVLLTPRCCAKITETFDTVDNSLGKWQPALSSERLGTKRDHFFFFFDIQSKKARKFKLSMGIQTIGCSSESCSGKSNDMRYIHTHSFMSM